MSQVTLRYLATAEPGLRWMRTYHRRNPQLDVIRAVDALRRAEAVLRAHPNAGHRYEDYEAVRELKIMGTAFSLLYTVARDTIWVVDVRDQRGLRSAEALRSFVAELGAKSDE
ncbi:type II toxin-antitoxin system RelE/ParE family toxin [uncultured Jannaschia sp.]|uniref:type II toxin-antitoxin system RelE/ParE family toxin n=1 Tax=uncultured Jannaschia sp. TaxID=293347 RepID=UPI0026076CF0|nr:type II toxin-antitoxin system RelE/ParE family toxin [uncultured Jannaschia sp.]